MRPITSTRRWLSFPTCSRWPNSHRIQFTNNLLRFALETAHGYKYDKSLPLQQQALSIQEQVYGEESINIAFTLESLANINIDLGLYEKALVINKRALAIRENVLGGNHVDTATSLNDVAATGARQATCRLIHAANC